MGDIVEFGDKKFDVDDNIDELLEDLLKEAENAGNSDNGKTDELGTAGEKDNLIHLPKKSWPPVDWGEAESIRKAEYSRIPKKVLSIIRKIFENPGDDGYFDFPDSGDAYPPNPIPIRPVLGDAVWMMDLLDRLGGEIRYGDRKCVIKRKKKRPPVFLIQPISLTTREALADSMRSLFEHYLESKMWVVWGKEVTDKMMFLIITNRQDEDRVYFGTFDFKTAWVLFRRMKDISIEKVLGL
jgi:hypothetical protein